MSSSDGWSDVAEQWASSWGPAAGPMHARLIEACGIGVGTRVLDVGCGSGELLAALDRSGAHLAGVDPAPGMLSLARRRIPNADLREASWGVLPWPAASFDAVTAVNALQFADDTFEALAEAVRLTRPGGLVAVANWAERSLNDLDSIDSALAIADGAEPMPDGDLQLPGGLEALFVDAGLSVIETGTVAVPWTAADAPTLLRGVLLDDPISESPGTRADDADEDQATRDVVIAAARPFRREDGSYVLHNTFRFAVGRVAGGPGTRPNDGRDDA